MKKKFNYFLTALVVLLISGCAKLYNMVVGEAVPAQFVGVKQNINLERVLLIADENANRGNAFKTHLIVAYDLQLAKDLSDMDADEYFNRFYSEQFARNYHGLYNTYQWDIIPGKRQPEIKLDIPNLDRAVGAYIFAEMQYPQQENRLRIPEEPHVIIKFSNRGLKIIDVRHLDR